MIPVESTGLVILPITKVHSQLCLHKSDDVTGHLAIIRSVEDELAVRNVLERENVTEAWLGFHSKFEKNEWLSVLDEQLDSFCYVHWRGDEPNVAQTSSTCVSYLNPGMQNQNCEGLLSYFCEYTGCPASAWSSVDVRYDFSNKQKWCERTKYSLSYKKGMIGILLRLSRPSEAGWTITRVENHFSQYVYWTIFFNTPCAKLDFAHARINSILRPMASKIRNVSDHM